MLKLFNADENVFVTDYVTAYCPSFSYEEHIFMTT